MSVLTDLDRFDHSGFVHGSTEFVTYYCMIPKNASSWISGVLGASGWTQGPIEDIFVNDPAWLLSDRARAYRTRPEIDNLIVVLRDPVERWVAGISQYLSTSVLHSHWYDRRQWNDGYDGQYIPGKENWLGETLTAWDFIRDYNEITERLLFDQIAFDDHTLPQSWFVAHFRYVKNHTWFYLNSDFSYNFRTGLGDLINPTVEGDFNRGADQEQTGQLEEFFRKRLIEKPYLRRQLERYYRRDYELINQVYFTHFNIPPGTSDDD